MLELVSIGGAEPGGEGVILLIFKRLAVFFCKNPPNIKWFACFPDAPRQSQEGTLGPGHQVVSRSPCFQNQVVKFTYHHPSGLAA